ncbi:serine hydrolase-like protein isoform X2 [Diorhabda sublineata]|nr:serine hydrolase-like protein isoform X2 [Diorhabda sublineata]
MDNAGSFDRLIPMLPPSFYYVCIDLPGHGKSSHFPSHLPIHTLNFILVYKQVSIYFKKKLIILGHSYGGQLGFVYAQMYPQCVEKLIMLDTVTIYPVPIKIFVDYLVDRLENYFKIGDNLKNKQPPTYTLEQALNKVQHGRNYSSIKRETAEVLLKRAIEPEGDRFKFTLDQRMKNFVNPLRDHRYNMESMNTFPVKCPILMILAKTWGEPEDPLVLCFHGIMDNAGTFNRLMPYLPNTFYYVGIDLPGHGKSSHFPPHVPIHVFNFLLTYKRISEHFKRKFIILGHSFGAQIGYIFAQLYPEKVKKLIMLDSITVFPQTALNFATYLRDKTNFYIQIEKKITNGVPPSYTKEEALHRLHTGRSYAPIKLEGAVALLERSINEIDDGKYIFTLDQRIKNTIVPLRNLRNVAEAIEYYPVRCPLLIILATESTSQQIYFSSILQLLKRQKNVRIKYAEGNHDVHNDYPERVAPLINKFLLYKSNKL